MWNCQMVRRVYRLHSESQSRDSPFGQIYSMRTKVPGKTCKKCGHDEYYIYNKRIKGCANCQCIKNRKRRQNDGEFRERERLRSKRRYELNPEKHNARVKQYRQSNREKYLENSRKYYQKTKNAQLLKNKERKESDISNFIAQQLRTKYNIHRQFPNDIRKYVEVDLSFLIKLWHKQNMKCAITGLPMVYKCHNLKSVSIDRIDSNQGYTEDNVQLVCKFVNLAKSNHTNDDVISVISELKS